MIVRVRPDRVPDPGPESLVTVIVVVLMLVLGLVPVIVLMIVAVAGLVAVVMARLVAVAGLVRVAVLAAHDPSMTRKTRCSISTPASRTRLRTARSCA